MKIIIVVRLSNFSLIKCGPFVKHVRARSVWILVCLSSITLVMCDFVFVVLRLHKSHICSIQIVVPFVVQSMRNASFFFVKYFRNLYPNGHRPVYSCLHKKRSLATLYLSYRNDLTISSVIFQVIHMQIRPLSHLRHRKGTISCEIYRLCRREQKDPAMEL